jgi:hypothetical protein
VAEGRVREPFALRRYCAGLANCKKYIFAAARRGKRCALFHFCETTTVFCICANDPLLHLNDDQRADITVYILAALPAALPEIFAHLQKTIKGPPGSSRKPAP